MPLAHAGAEEEMEVEALHVPSEDSALRTAERREGALESYLNNYWDGADFMHELIRYDTLSRASIEEEDRLVAIDHAMQESMESDLMEHCPHGEECSVADGEASGSSIVQGDVHLPYCRCSNGAYPCVHVGTPHLATPDAVCGVCERPLCEQCSDTERCPASHQLRECCSCRWSWMYAEMQVDATDEDLWPLPGEHGASSEATETVSCVEDDRRSPLGQGD